MKRAQKNKKLYLPLFENKLNPKKISEKLKHGIKKSFDISSFLPIRENEEAEEFDEETIELLSDEDYVIINQNIRDSRYKLQKEHGTTELGSLVSNGKKEKYFDDEEGLEEFQSDGENEEVEELEFVSSPKISYKEKENDHLSETEVVKKVINSKYLGKIEILEIEFPVKLKLKEKIVKAVHDIEVKIGDAVHNIESKIEQVVDHFKKKHVKNLNVEERLNAVKGYLVPFPKKFLLTFNFSSWKKNLPTSIFV